MKKLLLISVIFLCGCFGWHYSDGDRVGTITKFSKKGLFIKTWEGEMMVNAATQNQGGIMTPEIFEFTVRDGGPVEAIKTALQSGKRVELTYSQDLYFTSVNGSTDHFVTAVSESGK